MTVLYVPGTPGETLYAGRASSTGPEPGTTVQALVLRERSGTEQAANFISKPFGVSFDQGDIVTGDFPQFVATGDVLCHPTVWNVTYWPDGSMRFLGGFMRVPLAIAGSGTLAVAIKTGGTAPSASALSTSTLTAASDIKVEATGLKNWAASLWTSSVNQGITDGDVEVLGTGEAGLMLRVYEGFRTGGSDHGQTGLWHYVSVLQNAVGGLYGLRHLGKFANGWHDVTSPAINVLVSEGVVLKNGGTTIRSIAPSAAARSFTWSTTLSAANVTGLVSGMAVKATTTGTLPTGLSSTTAYFVRLTGGTGFTLHPSINDVEFNANAISVTGAGSGTHTLTPVFHLEAYAAGPYTVGADTEEDFIQAGGTGSECTVDIEVDRDYAKASRVMGPVRTDISPTILADRSYSIDTYVDVVVGQDGTGERPDIGWISGYCLRHWVRKDRFKTIRTYTMQQGLKAWSLRRLSTMAPLNLTDDTYTALGTAMQTYRFRPSNTAANSGVNAASDWGKMYGAQDWAHQPHFLAYTYFISGHPVFLDGLHDMAVAAIANTTNRNPTVSGTTYSAITLLDETQIRVDAWITRDVAWAAMFTPDTYCGAPLGTYFRAILAENFDYLKAKKLTGTSFSQTHSFYPSNNAQQGSWQLSYLLSTFNLAYTATGDADAKAAIDGILANFNAQRVNIGLHPISGYNTYIVGGPLAVTAWSDLVFAGALGTVVSDGATDVFTASPATGFGSLANNVVAVCLGFEPSGITVNQKNYVRDLSGSTFKLAASPGGTALDVGSSTIGGDYWAASLVSPSNTTMAESGGPKRYAESIVATTRWAKALGATMPSGFETAIETVYGAGPTFTDDPVYALSASFAP